MTTAPGTPPWVLPPPPPPPGALVDTDRWTLTLPIPTADDTPWQVAPPALATFTHPLYFYADSLGWVHYVAPVVGATDDAVTRCELRQIEPWRFDDDHDHVLTATLACDLTSLPAPRAVVAQIQRVADGPRIAVIVDQTELPGRVLVDAGGPDAEVLAGVDRDSPVTVRLSVTGDGPGRRVYLFAGYGDAIPTTPALTWPLTDFDRDEHRFTVGAVNTTPAAWARFGKAIVRHKRLTLV